MPFECRLFSIGERRSLVSALLGGLVFLVAADVYAAEYYVAPTGDDGNAGTIDKPFATLQKGHNVAVAGDTVWLRGGTYKIVNGASNMSGINISKSGTSDAKRIKFWAYQKEVPVFDFAQLKLSATETSGGIYVTGSWLHFKGLEIANVPMPGGTSNNGIWAVGGSNNTFELMNFHHNSGPGLSIAKGTGGNLILNCDSHDNYDATSDQGAGQNADGFGLHYQASGPPTIYRGNRAWWNADDGYDFFRQEVAAIIENCWSIANGYTASGTKPASNGAGFKMGNSHEGVRHTVRNNLAWKNKAEGFYGNHSYGGSDWFNNTAYNNGVAFDMLSDITLSGSKVHVLRNNIAFPNKNSNMGPSDMKFNTWDLNLTVTEADFVSVSDTGWMGPRKADGSLPDIDFMKLRQGSQVIDKGTDVKLKFVGTAPDLGAYEFGASAAGGSAGSDGTGGSGGAATGGAAGSAATGGAAGSAATGGAAGSAATGGAAGGAATGGAAGTQEAGGSGGDGEQGGAAAGAGGSAAGGSGATAGGSAGGSTLPPGATGGGAATAGANGPPAADPAGCACEVGLRSARGPGEGLLLAMVGLALIAKRRRAA